jgi:hypothetical protein
VGAWSPAMEDKQSILRDLFRIATATVYTLHTSSFIFFFKTEYVILIIKIFSFILTSPTSIYLYFSPSPPPTRAHSYFYLLPTHTPP